MSRALWAPSPDSNRDKSAEEASTRATTGARIETKPAVEEGMDLSNRSTRRAHSTSSQDAEVDSRVAEATGELSEEEVVSA